MNTSFERSINTKVEWLTPPELVKKLGEFDLDPCSPVNAPFYHAKNNYTYSNNVKTNFYCHICDNLKTHCYIFLNAVFTKPFFSIHNLAHFFFVKNRQKIKELNFYPQQYCARPLSGIFAHLLPVSQKRLACGSMVFKNKLI